MSQINCTSRADIVSSFERHVRDDITRACAVFDILRNSFPMFAEQAISPPNIDYGSSLRHMLS